MAFLQKLLLQIHCIRHFYGYKGKLGINYCRLNGSYFSLRKLVCKPGKMFHTSMDLLAGGTEQVSLSWLSLGAQMEDFSLPVIPCCLID